MLSHLLPFALFFCVLFGFTNEETKTGSFTDPRDGQHYATVKIGKQTWMAQNLNYEIAGSWCEACDTFGRMYNFTAAKAEVPPGWHLPTVEEWKTLIAHEGGNAVAGGKLKSKELWNAPNTGASNSSGFSAVAAHYRTVDGKIRDAGSKATFWTATETEEPAAWTYNLRAAKADIMCMGFYKSSGFSVRCVKDE